MEEPKRHFVQFGSQRIDFHLLFDHHERFPKLTAHMEQSCKPQPSRTVSFASYRGGTTLIDWLATDL